MAKMTTATGQRAKIAAAGLAAAGMLAIAHDGEWCAVVRAADRIAIRDAGLAWKSTGFPAAELDGRIRELLAAGFAPAIIRAE